LLKYREFKKQFQTNFGPENLRIKVLNTLALPILFDGSEIWTLRKEDKKRLTSIEIKFFRRVAGTFFLTTKEMKKVVKS